MFIYKNQSVKILAHSSQWNLAVVEVNQCGDHKCNLFIYEIWIWICDAIIEIKSNACLQILMTLPHDVVCMHYTTNLPNNNLN